MNDLQEQLVQLVKDAVNQHWSWGGKSIAFRVCQQCGGIIGPAYNEKDSEREICPLCSPQEKQPIRIVSMDALEAFYLHDCGGWGPTVFNAFERPDDVAWEKVYRVFQSLATLVVRENGMAYPSVLIEVSEDDEDRVQVAICGRWNISEEAYLLLAQRWCHWRFTWDSLDEMAADLEDWYHAMTKKAKLASAMRFLAGCTPEQLEGAAIAVEDRLRDYLQWVQGGYEAGSEAEWQESVGGEGDRDYYPGFGDDLCRASTILNTLARTLS